MAHAAQISPLNRRLRQVHSAPNKIVLLLSYLQGCDSACGGDKFHLRKLSAKRNNLYWFSKSNSLKCNIRDITRVATSDRCGAVEQVLRLCGSGRFVATLIIN